MAGDSTPMPLQRPSVLPVLRTAAEETGRLVAMVAGYAALIGLFVLATLSVWGVLPDAVASSHLVPGLGGGPPQLRGSL